MFLLFTLSAPVLMASSRFQVGLRFARRHPLPIGAGAGAGAAVLGYLQFRRRRKLVVEDEEPFYIAPYKWLPLSSFSRLWGKVNDLELPVWSRPWVLGAYSRAFGCDLSEAKDPSLSSYPNLGRFFHRELRDGVRPVDQTPGTLASPCDGKVLIGGPLENDQDKVEPVSYTHLTLPTIYSV